MTVRNTRPDVFTDEDRAALRAWCAGREMQPAPAVPVTPERGVDWYRVSVYAVCALLPTAWVWTLLAGGWWLARQVGR